jgi:chromosome segregation ATPase
VSSGSNDLARLNAQERSLSARRARLQDRIDFLRAGGGGPEADVSELIADLQRKERELSEQRRELHVQIELARTRLTSSGSA